MSAVNSNVSKWQIGIEQQVRMRVISVTAVNTEMVYDHETAYGHQRHR